MIQFMHMLIMVFKINKKIVNKNESKVALLKFGKMYLMNFIRIWTFEKCNLVLEGGTKNILLVPPDTDVRNQ